ncbi:hypothetical protein [Candidatus Blastococcus massiliensis]|uniref:hypothetical protein n=1 Tax=Candidatus Blastococcus massiliensis TaxID=1470358 RepID=UPI0004AD4D02|nr:hypothetical protein [Candidatus Blastococcus massiliensis]
MNRTLRNGLAVAGMAGGMFFLGQAAASADTEANQTVTPTADAANLSLGSGGGATAGNDTTAINIAAQVSATSVSTNASTGGSISVSQNSGDNNVSTYGGSGTVHANTGNEAKVAVSTGDINGSGNVSGDVVKKAGSGGGDVTANQTVTPSATAKNASASLFGGGGGASAGNQTTAINAAIDVDLTSLSTNADTGPDIDVYQSSGDNDVECKALLCRVDADTGNSVDIKVVTGDINDSANIGGHHDGYGHRHGDHQKPAYQRAEHREHKRPAVAPAKRAVITRSSAQPSNQLAYTGAETSLPLTLGLIALGAGGALTLAGRRRSSTAAA